MSAILVNRQSLLRGHVLACWTTVTIAMSVTFAPPAWSQCIDRDERAPPAAIAAFIADPSVLLRQTKNDRDKLSGRLAGLIATDIAALAPVRDVLREASQADRVAIGSGLHRAEARCIAGKPELARRISEFVSKLHDGSVLKGYLGDLDAGIAAAPANPAPSAVANAPGGPGSSAGLLSGEWKTDVADPFKPVPLPE